MAFHVALLGDSIFDNRSYTRGEPDVVSHLRSVLPADWHASLFAVDGNVTRDLAGQLLRVSTDVTHLVISVGGNDALMNMDLLARPVSSTTEALRLFGARVFQFETDYRTAIDGALALGRLTTTCTIYNGNLPADQAPTARIALMMFNDVILRVAFEHHLKVIDLRLICNEPADYANPIEPSGRGGRKIAEAIARQPIGVVASIARPRRVACLPRAKLGVDEARAINESVEDVEHTTCSVVGGGPAGVMLALLLARRGVDTIMLEAYRDFDRDVRGDPFISRTWRSSMSLARPTDFSSSRTAKCGR